MHGIQFLQGFKIYVHPTCTHAIEEFNTYLFDQDKQGNWLNKPIDKNNHFLDALRYSVERYHIKEQDTSKTHEALKSLGL